MIWQTTTRWLPSRIGEQFGGSRVLCIGLVTLAIGYLSLGFVTLLFDTGFSYPVDLRLRWIEQGMIYQGLNPQERTYPEELLPESIVAQRNVRGSYPPWSYATGIALVPPLEWRQARAYFAAINGVALAALACWAYLRCKHSGTKWGLVAAASVLGIFSVCICLSYGQYSALVLAFLVACLAFLERGQMAAGGLCLGLAAVKPHLAGLFFLVPAIYPYPMAKKFWFFATAIAYLALASLSIALFVGSSPWEMLRATTTESVKYYNLSNNPLVIWSAQAFGFSLGSKLLAMLMVGICTALLLAVRRREDLLTGFSICAILSLYWSYSRHYDFLILAIPLVELLRLWRTRGSTSAGVAFMLLGIMLWCPIRIEMSRWPLVELTYALVNIVALASMTIQGHSTSEALSVSRRRESQTMARICGRG